MPDYFAILSSRAAVARSEALKERFHRQTAEHHRMFPEAGTMAILPRSMPIHRAARSGFAITPPAGTRGSGTPVACRHEIHAWVLPSFLWRIAGIFAVALDASSKKEFAASERLARASAGKGCALTPGATPFGADLEAA